MTGYHLSADASGESRISPLPLPLRETAAGTVHGLTDIPAQALGMAQFIGRKPDVGMHVAPRRQFLVVLGGVLELVSSSGDTEHLVAGDFVLADDIGSSGHISRDVGEEPLMLMAIAIDQNWQFPVP